MRNLILILVMALGATLQAQTFDFSCELTDAELQAQDILAVTDEIASLDYNDLWTASLFDTDSFVASATTVENLLSAAASATAKYNVIYDSEIDPDNKDIWGQLQWYHGSIIEYYINEIQIAYDDLIGG